MRTLFLALMALIMSYGPTQNKDPEKKPSHTLWAAISTNKPVYLQPKDPSFHEVFTIYFGLVNDGTKTVDPEIGSSHLLINGVEPKNWSMTINNGLRSDKDKALPPGDDLIFACGLESHFREPGIYKVVWKGKNFESPVMTLRVLASER